MARTHRYSAGDMIRALSKTKGMVYLAAKELECSHTTVYNYIKRHPSVKNEFDFQRGELKDAAEMRLREAVYAGEKWAVQFTLTMLGGSRGYATKQKHELTGKKGGPIETRGRTIDLSSLPDDELEILGRVLARLDDGASEGDEEA